MAMLARTTVRLSAISGMLLASFWTAWLTSRWLTVRSGGTGVGVEVGVGVREGVGVRVAVPVIVGVGVGVQVPMPGGTAVTTSSCATSSAVAWRRPSAARTSVFMRTVCGPSVAPALAPTVLLVKRPSPAVTSP